MRSRLRDNDHESTWHRANTHTRYSKYVCFPFWALHLKSCTVCNSGSLSFSGKSFHLPFPQALSKPSSVRKPSPHKLVFLKVQGHSFPKADLGSGVGGAGGEEGVGVH